MPNVSMIRRVVPLLEGVLFGASVIACGKVTVTPQSNGGDVDGGGVDVPGPDAPSTKCETLSAPAAFPVQSKARRVSRTDQLQQ